MPKESKPRFDGKGSIFGNIHRELPSSFCMFDVDRIYATVRQALWLRREEECFVEYRHISSGIEFIALFELKHRFTNAALDPVESSNIARLEMARALHCRLFVVIETNGKQPLDFYEIDTETGKHKKVYILRWENGKGKGAIEECWKALDLW